MKRNNNDLVRILLLSFLTFLIFQLSLFGFSVFKLGDRSVWFGIRYTAALWSPIILILFLLTLFIKEKLKKWSLVKGYFICALLFLIVPVVYYAWWYFPDFKYLFQIKNKREIYVWQRFLLVGSIAYRTIFYFLFQRNIRSL